MLRLLADWLATHTVVFTLSLFVASAVVSIYSNEAKTVLHVWPIKVLRHGSRNRSVARLALLYELHGSAYRLLLYLARTVTSVLIGSLFWYAVIGVYTVVRRHQFPHTPWGLWSGLWVAKLWDVFGTLYQLGDYENATAKLRRKVVRSSEKLGIAVPTFTTRRVPRIPDGAEERNG